MTFLVESLRQAGNLLAEARGRFASPALKERSEYSGKRSMLLAPIAGGRP